MTVLSAVVSNPAREAVDQFLKEFEMLAAGKNPDGVGAFDDWWGAHMTENNKKNKACRPLLAIIEGVKG